MPGAYVANVVHNNAAPRVRVDGVDALRGPPTNIQQKTSIRRAAVREFESLDHFEAAMLT